MAKSGKINGFPWKAEPFRPTSIQAAFLCQSIEQLREVFPVVQEKLLADFSNEVLAVNPLVQGADGTTFCHPMTCGVFLFDPKNGAKLGNYMAEKPLTKDNDPVKLAEKVMTQAYEGLKDNTSDVNSKGLALQFAYFSPLQVQIGLEWGTKVKDAET